MRVALDVSSAIDPRPSGVARYIHGLVDGLVTRDDLDLTLLCRSSRWRRGDPREVFPPALLPRAPLVRWYDWRALRGFDLVHAPDLRLPRRPASPLVVTVHDLSALDREDHATARFVEKKRAHLARVATHASRVITHTKVVRLDLAERAGLPLDQVDCVPLWPALPRSERSELAPADRSGLLLVGGPSPRKGSDRITEFLSRYDRAVAPSTNTEKREAVAWCGSASDAEARQFFAALPEETRTRIEWLGHVEDNELDRRLSSARAFVQLSGTEGFGIPLLESAVRRCPVIVYRSETAEEVLPRSGAFWIGGADEETELAAFADREERERRVECAARHADTLTHEHTIDRTVSVYRDAISRARASVSVG